MLQIGSIVSSRYKVEAFLKSGVGTELWQARDMKLRRQIIIRMVKDNYLDNSHYVARFAHDAQVLAQLEHPHIVPIYDYGVHEERPFQIQRYIGIPTLEDVLTEKIAELDTMSLLRLLQQIASAIDYIHERGIVHRDLYPHNIIVDERNIPYLTNFSLALLMKNHGLAVEVFSDSKEASQDEISKDIFAFGLIAYQIVTHGQKPRYLHNQFVNNVRHYRPDLPIGVDLVINRLAHADPEQRYSSAGEAVEDLYRAFYSGQSSIEGQIFISYARKDSEYVYTLAKELRRIGLDIWIDQDIEPGSNWDKTIEEALRDSEKMLLIVSPASMLSENVQDEWSYFLEEGKPVFPFIHQDCEMSFRLRRRQYITSTEDLLSDIARIVDVLAGGNPTKLNTFVE